MVQSAYCFNYSYSSLIERDISAAGTSARLLGAYFFWTTKSESKIVIVVISLSHILSSFELVIILLAFVVVLTVSIATTLLPLRLQSLVLWLGSGIVLAVDTDRYVC